MVPSLSQCSDASMVMLPFPAGNKAESPRIKSFLLFLGKVKCLLRAHRQLRTTTDWRVQIVRGFDETSQSVALAVTASVIAMRLNHTCITCIESYFIARLYPALKEDTFTVRQSFKITPLQSEQSLRHIISIDYPCVTLTKRV